MKVRTQATFREWCCGPAATHDGVDELSSRLVGYDAYDSTGNYLRIHRSGGKPYEKADRRTEHMGTSDECRVGATAEFYARCEQLRYLNLSQADSGCPGVGTSGRWLEGGRFWTNCQPNLPLMHRCPRVTS